MATEAGGGGDGGGGGSRSSGADEAAPRCCVYKRCCGSACVCASQCRTVVNHNQKLALRKNHILKAKGPQWNLQHSRSTLSAVDVAYLNAALQFRLPVGEPEGTVHPAVATMCLMCRKFIGTELKRLTFMEQPGVREAVQQARSAVGRHERVQKRARALTRNEKRKCDDAEHDAINAELGAKRKVTMDKRRQEAQQDEKIRDTAAVAAPVTAAVTMDLTPPDGLGCDVVAEIPKSISDTAVAAALLYLSAMCTKRAPNDSVAMRHLK